MTHATHARPLHVGIDATGLGRFKTGTAVYTLEILRVWNADKTLDARFELFVSPKTRMFFDELGLDERFTYHFAPNHRGLRSLWQHTVLPFRLRHLHCDVLWGVTFIVPAFAPCPSVVTVHDMTYQTMPAVHERLKRWYLRLAVGWGLRKARTILAISEATRADIERLFPAVASKIQVTLLAARRFPEESRMTPDRSPDPYVLAIGTLEPRKNIHRLLAAWRALDPAVRGRARLCIAGCEGWMMGDLGNTKSQEEAGIEFLGYIEEARLRKLLAGALFLAYPSLYEGFGLPVIEAMSLGVPVLTSAVGATAEVAGDAACLVDPWNTASVQQGLVRLLQDIAWREDLRVRGRLRAGKFSWEATAKETFLAMRRNAH
ncbi:MAG: glycosyltransferase family 1 protein [Gammaproteobacteria bacterium]|nr:glycosyltransferase family 1 protein [Gammaproteobacteria bacterium]